METTIEPRGKVKLTPEQLAECVAADLHEFSGLPIRARLIPNDWESHLPAIETLHERLDEQQRGE